MSGSDGSSSRITAAIGWLAAAIALAALAYVWTESHRSKTPAEASKDLKFVDSGTPVNVAGPQGVSTHGSKSESWESVVGRVMPAVVQIETSRGLGSGFFVSSDTVITNYHVIDGESYVTLRFADKATLQASVANSSKEHDVAMLKVWSPRSDQATIPFGKAASLSSGQEVIAIGSPHGIQNTVTRGIVSGLRQLGQVSLVQTDVALNPGNSGGPLLDHNGNVVAINTMIFRGSQGLNFAVAIEHAQALVEGRTQAPIASTVTGESNSGQMPSANMPSETDRVRAQGAQLYEAKLQVIAQRAAALDDYWNRVLASGFDGKATGRFEHGWYAVWEPSTMEGSVRKGYEDQFADLKRRAEEIRGFVVSCEDEARRADVYPGDRRQLRERYRLNYPGWHL
jgi:S1-C subfamily serine protease